MNRALLSKRISSLLAEVSRLSNALCAMNTMDLQRYPENYELLSTDAALRAELNGKLSGTTKIIVAQRISTIRHADEIIVLDRGEAVGIGTHDELMRSCAVYQEIARSQLSAAELA